MSCVCTVLRIEKLELKLLASLVLTRFSPVVAARPGVEPFQNPDSLLTACTVDLPGNRIYPMDISIDNSDVHYVYVCLKRDFVDNE